MMRWTELMVHLLPPRGHPNWDTGLYRLVSSLPPMPLILEHSAPCLVRETDCMNTRFKIVIHSHHLVNFPLLLTICVDERVVGRVLNGLESSTQNMPTLTNSR